MTQELSIAQFIISIMHILYMYFSNNQVIVYYVLFSTTCKFVSGNVPKALKIKITITIIICIHKVEFFWNKQ